MDGGPPVVVRSLALPCGFVSGSLAGRPFASDCHKHSRDCLADRWGTGLAILDSKIGPVVIDFKCELRAAIAASRPRFSATSKLVSFSPLMKQEPVLCCRSEVAPGALSRWCCRPCGTCPICSSGALLKANIDSSRSTSSLMLLLVLVIHSRAGDSVNRYPRPPRAALSSMLARPMEKFPVCGSSASSQPSRCWFIIAVAMAKCSAGAPPSFSGFGLSFASIVGA